MTKPDASNILNLQMTRPEAEMYKGKGIISDYDWEGRCDYTGSGPVNLKGKCSTYTPQNDHGKWIAYPYSAHPTFADRVAAVNGYLAFLELKFGNVRTALIDPSGTIGGFAASLGAYGTDSRYRNVPELTKRLKNNAGRQARYAADRIAALKEGERCGNDFSKQIAAMEIIRAAALKAAR